MGIKKYDRKLAVSSIKNKVDIELLNAKLKTFFISCGMQMTIFNSVFSQNANQDDYKNLVREYSKSKRDYRKVSRIKKK